MSNGSSLAARLLGISLACAVLLVVGVVGPSQASAGCRLSGVTVTTGGGPRSGCSSRGRDTGIPGSAAGQCGRLAIVLSNCELADGFKLPALVPESAISQIEYRLSLLAGVQSVELTIHMRSGTYKGYSVDNSVSGSLKIILAPASARELRPPRRKRPAASFFTGRGDALRTARRRSECPL